MKDKIFNTNNWIIPINNEKLRYKRMRKNLKEMNVLKPFKEA